MVKKNILRKKEKNIIIDRLTAKSKMTQKDIEDISFKIDSSVAKKLSLRK